MYELNHFRWSKLKGDLIQLVYKRISLFIPPVGGAEE
jgi:hypothetical protein